MTITPVAVQAFQLTQTVTPGTYLLVSGVPGQQIRLLSYNIISTAGTLIVRDTSGVIIVTLNGNSSRGLNGIYTLTTGAGLEAVIDTTTTVNAYFVGFISA